MIIKTEIVDAWFKKNIKDNVLLEPLDQVIHPHMMNKHGLVFLSPVSGLRFEDRLDHLSTISKTPFKNVRFQIELKKEGPGAGGLEYVAYKKSPNVIKSRIGLITQSNDSDNFGDLIGSVGWVPKEISPYLRKALYGDSIVTVSHASLIETTNYRYKFAFYLLVVVWGQKFDDMQELYSAYTCLFQEHRLHVIKDIKFDSVWDVIPGYNR